MKKKATTKRERKYGKKDEDGIQVKKPRNRGRGSSKKTGKVRLMVDGYTVLTFKSREEAEEYIEAKNAKSREKRQRLASFIFL